MNRLYVKSMGFIKKHIEDIFILSGWTTIVLTTFFINKYIGYYLLGISLILFGLFLIKFPRR